MTHVCYAYLIYSYTQTLGIHVNIYPHMHMYNIGFKRYILDNKFIVTDLLLNIIIKHNTLQMEFT